MRRTKCGHPLAVYWRALLYTPGVRKVASSLFTLLLAAPFAVFAQTSPQAPTIVALQNNYSYTLPFAPNYGIAQGSIFIIRGANLAPASTNLQAYPLPTLLLGVTLSVTINNTVTHPYLYYVTPGQIAAILPSATPQGTGTITVNNSGLMGSAPIQVVQSAFGILTLNSGGTGPAAAFDATANPLTPVSAATPGATITLWGSGAGPVSGDESNLQTPANLTNVPMEVDIGGISATVSYHGRSLYAGVDQINVVVPPTVQPGCWVSVVVRNGASIGNFATIPVAAAGQTACSDAVTGYTGTQLQALYNKSSFSVGSIAIGSYNVPPESTLRPPIPAETWDNASATFVRYPSAAVFNAQMLTPTTPVNVAAAAVSMGSCMVNPVGYIDTAPTIQYAYLDAGPGILITGAGGTQTLTPIGGYYGAPSTGSVATGGNVLSNAFITPAGDTFTFVNTPGAAVAGFSAKAAVPPAFVWNEMSTLTSVNRAQGATVTWQNAAANSYVQVTGMSSATFGDISLITSFTCSVPAAAGTFTVPSSVLLSLPATASSPGINSAAFLAVANYTFPQAFSTTGIDVGTAYGYVIDSTGFNYGFIYQ